MESPARISPGTSGGGLKRAIVVEMMDMREAEQLCQFLQGLGYEAEHIRNPQRAIRNLRHAEESGQPIHAVVIGTIVQQESMLDLLTEMRAINPDANLIVMMGFGYHGDQGLGSAQLRNLNVERLLKPFRPDQLLRSLGLAQKEEEADCCMAMPPQADQDTNNSSDSPSSNLPAANPPENLGDEVECSVHAPSSIAAGETIFVQAFVHLPEQAEAVAKLAQEFDDATSKRGSRTLDSFIALGTRLEFQLTMPGLEIDDPTPPAITWRGRPESVQFAVTAAEDAKQRTVIGTVLVMQDSVPIGQIKFKLSLLAGAAGQNDTAMSSAAQPSSEPEKQGSMTRYRAVFISYASKDRDEVLKRVQMLKRFQIRFFQDVLDLEPGERWEQSLYKHIDESDLFLLFWSSAAKNSQWVREEVKYALRRRDVQGEGMPEIVPVVLEGPPVPEPLPELSHLHFNDQILHFVADRYASPS